MSDAMTRARALLEARAGELRDEISMIDEALKSFSPNRAAGSRAGRKRAQKRSSARPARPRRQARRSKRIPRAEREQALLAFARMNPEATNKRIAKELRVTPGYVSQMIKGLSEGGSIKRKNGKLSVKR